MSGKIEDLSSIHRTVEIKPMIGFTFKFQEFNIECKADHTLVFLNLALYFASVHLL